MENVAPIRSVSRSISVLQAINRHGSLSMMAIAKHESLPYPTTYRIVQTLLHEGLIEQEPTRKHYRPTALVQSLAHGYHAEGRLIDCAGPVMRDLTRQIGWPVFVSERVGTRMVVRDATHAETSLTFGLCYPGFNMPLLTSATGQAWIGHIPEGDVDSVIAWSDVTADAKMDGLMIRELKQQLAAVQLQGYCARACLNTSPNRSASIAVPIFAGGRIKAVLTLVYFHSAMQQSTAIERYLAPLRDAADGIAARMETCP
jgi:IclR family mhp operon transcriptional activator